MSKQELNKEQKAALAQLKRAFTRCEKAGFSFCGFDEQIAYYIGDVKGIDNGYSYSPVVYAALNGYPLSGFFSPSAFLDSCGG